MSAPANELSLRGVANLVIAAPTIAAITYTLPKAMDPQSSFTVSLLANVGTRLLMLAQAVILFAALPISLIAGLFSVYIKGESIFAAGMFPALYGAMIPACFFAAVIPQRSLMQMGELAGNGENSLSRIFERFARRDQVQEAPPEELVRREAVQERVER